MKHMLALIVLLLCSSCAVEKVTTPLSKPKPALPTVIGFINTNASNDPWPQVGAVLNDMCKRKCTGTLIAPNIVLTAEHCITDETMYFETYDGRVHEVESVEVFPLFINTDISLLILEEPILDIVPLEIAPNIDFLKKGYPLSVVGYSRGWKKHSVPGAFWYYGILQGEEMYFKTIPFTGSVYFGDSGGPAIAYHNGTKYIVGVTSHLMYRYGQIVENGFARVDQLYHWIKGVENANCWDRL